MPNPGVYVDPVYVDKSLTRMLHQLSSSVRHTEDANA